MTARVKGILLTITLLYSASCSPSELPNPTLSTSAIEVQTETIVQPTPIPRDTQPQTTTAIPTTKQSGPTIAATTTRVCASEKVQKFSELGLGGDEYLLLKPIGASTLDVWLMSSKDSTPQSWTSQFPLGEILRVIGTSSDSRSLALISRESDGSGNRLWFLSLPDGSSRSVLIGDSRLLGYWAGNSGVILLDYWTGGSMPVPVEFVDYNTLQTTPLPLPSDDAISLGATRLGAMYLAGNQWFLLDYHTGDEDPLFHWLSDNSDFYNDPFSVFANFRVSAEQDNSHFSVVVKRSYGLDYAFLDYSHATRMSEYQDAMTQVVFPESYRDFHLGHWSPDHDILTFDYTPSARPGSRILALASIGQQEVAITDLCVDRAGGDSLMPDRQLRLLAWTQNESTESSSPVATMVVQIETGKILELPGFEVIGWGNASTR